MSKRVRAPDIQPVRANRPRQVAELLPDVGRAAFRKFGFVQSALLTRWPEIVGARWAAVSCPESLRFPVGQKAQGTLTLTVRGAHAPMMQHILPDIVERVNRFFGYAAVARIAMKQGEVAARPVRRPAPAPAPLSVEMGESLKAIGDPELKAVLEALAIGVSSTRGVPKVS